MVEQTQAAFAELVDELGALQRRLVEQLSEADDEATLLEAHRWILSILQVATDVHVWADPARPRFVDIVGPYKKWGGDNADAFYCFAPIDPTRAYRVRVHIGRRRLSVPHCVRGPQRRSLLRAHRGQPQQHPGATYR